MAEELSHDESEDLILNEIKTSAYGQGLIHCDGLLEKVPYMESIETRSIKESAETKNIPAAKRLEEAGWKPAYCPRPQKKGTSPRKQIAK